MNSKSISWPQTSIFLCRPKCHITILKKLDVSIQLIVDELEENKEAESNEEVENVEKADHDELIEEEGEETIVDEDSFDNDYEDEENTASVSSEGSNTSVCELTSGSFKLSPHLIESDFRLILQEKKIQNLFDFILLCQKEINGLRSIILDFQNIDSKLVSTSSKIFSNSKTLTPTLLSSKSTSTTIVSNSMTSSNCPSSTSTNVCSVKKLGPTSL